MTEQIKQAVEQAIERFSTILREAFDEAVENAKNQIKEEFEKARLREFEKLFDTQLETLKARGVPEILIKDFRIQRNEVVKKAMGMKIGEGNIPFVPVIPLRVGDLYPLMEMLGDFVNDLNPSFLFDFVSDLNPSFLSDVVEVPKNLYYIYDVASGVNLGNRSPLTVTEIIALRVHLEELSKLDMIALGSRYGGSVPFIYKYVNSHKLTTWEMSKLDCWEKLAIPSCSSRG